MAQDSDPGGQVIPFPSSVKVEVALALEGVDADSMELGFLACDVLEALQADPDSPDDMRRAVRIARVLRSHGWGLR